MKVTYLNAGGGLGGAERSLLDVMASVKTVRPAWRQHLIAAEDGPLAAKARELGAIVSVVPFPSCLARVGDAGAGGPAGRQKGRLAIWRDLCGAGPAAVRYVARLRRAISACGSDLVHSNGLKMHILGVWAAPHRVPALWHVRDYVGLRPVMAHLVRAHARRCAAAVVNSESVARDLRAVCRGRLPVVVAYNGIDLEEFRPEGKALTLDALAGLPPAAAGAVKIGIVATLARWKGHEVLFRALAQLPATIAFRAYVIGDALYQTEGSQHTLDELRDSAARLGLSGKVGFTGFVTETAAALRALDIVVHASVAPEPFGRVIAEAMACGRAVIASDGGGAAEIVSPGIDALTHPPGDAGALAERIAKLAVDPGLRARLGRAGRITVERRFNRARLAQRILSAYRLAVSAAQVADGELANSEEMKDGRVG